MKHTVASKFRIRMHLIGRRLKTYYQALFPTSQHFIVFAVTLILITLVATPELIINRPELKAGNVAQNDVIAPFRFTVPKTPAERQMEEERLMSAEPDIFDYNDNKTVEALSRADRLLADLSDPSLANLRRTNRSKWEERIRDILPTISQNEAQVLEVLPVNGRARFLSSLREIMERGVATELKVKSDSASRNVAFTAGGNSSLLLHPREDLLDIPEARRLIEQKMREAFPEPPGLASSLSTISSAVLVPNLTLREDLTREARDRARRLVKPEYATVLENERIVEAHAVVTAEQERKLTALSDATKTGVAGWIWAGRCLLVFVVLMSMGVFLRYYRRDWFDSLSAWLVLASLFLGSTLLYRLTQFLFAGRMEITDYAFPAAFGAIFVTLLFDIHLGVAFATLISILTPILAGYDITLSIMSIIGGLAGAFAVRNTRRRSEIYFTVLLIILANSLTIMSLGLMRAQTLSLVLQELMWGCINAVASVILASVLLPFAERTFRILSPLHLVELSDLQHPIIRRLNSEAPGTYQHSLAVGNLVEPVAEAIGSNGLLARVGAYFHDIGKIARPHYYMENFTANTTIYEKLSPALATKVILGHVSEGIRLARQSSLPEPLVKFIAEHHGTSQISFLYREALENDEHGMLSPDDFRYPGPRPGSKETALVMLADACESAARSLVNPTPSELEGLVESIVQGKLDDGQLSRSPLTLADITVIKEGLLRGLLSVHHRRVSYPKDKS